VTPWILTALLFQFAAPVVSGPKDLVLNVDVFRGSRSRAVVVSSAASPASTTILSPWASGWSGDAARLSTEIRDVARLDRAALVLRDSLTQEKRTGTIRGSDYWVAVRFLDSTTRNVELEIRIVPEEGAEKGGGSMPAVRLSAELGKTVVVRGGQENEPLYAALTLKDPLALRWRSRIWLPQPSSPIRPAYPEAARRANPGGTIVIKALIDADGTLVEPFVLQSLHPDLDAVALDAVRNARFRPATLDGNPVAAMMTVSCTFQRTAR
jgi:TonB family protein